MYMSKQLPMDIWAPKHWLCLARAYYAQMLRDAAAILNMVEKNPRAESDDTATKSKQDDGLFRFRRTPDALAVTNAALVDPNAPQTEGMQGGAAEVDRDQLDIVTDEMERWRTIDKYTIDGATKDGLVNEFQLIYKLRNNFPLHYTVFKQVSSHIAHEANTERLFSLAGALSDDNGKMCPESLAIWTSVGANMGHYKPGDDAILKRYMSKYSSAGADEEDEDAA